jgi:hypothetical protein
MINTNALLAPWKLDEVPACREGIELAHGFFAACGRAVNRAGIEESVMLRADFEFVIAGSLQTGKIARSAMRLK